MVGDLATTVDRDDLDSRVMVSAAGTFLLALAYRRWQLQGNDEVQDDVEDRIIAGRIAASDDTGADAEADAEAEALDAVRETATRIDDIAIGADGFAVRRGREDVQ